MNGVVFQMSITHMIGSCQLLISRKGICPLPIPAYCRMTLKKPARVEVNIHAHIRDEMTVGIAQGTSMMARSIPRAAEPPLKQEREKRAEGSFEADR